MTLDHIWKLFERVIKIEDQFDEIDSRELDEGDTEEDTEKTGGDLVPLDADIADENDVMPGFYDFEDFEYQCSIVISNHVNSGDVMTFVLPYAVAAPHCWVKPVFSGTAILWVLFFGFLLMYICSKDQEFI